MSGWISAFLFISMAAVNAAVFILPTPNQALLKSGPGEDYLVGTIGKPWPSGGFGCVRTEGLKMHEGIDIRCTQRDKRGEPIDPVYASASGKVAYISAKVGLSNYGRYVVIRHSIEGLEVCTLYGHLSAIAEDLAVGKEVKQGQVIGTLGRSTNTREGISKDRAHLHFEVNFILNDRFAEWHQRNMAGSRNDHGNWNGLNLVAIDPQELLIASAREGASFSLAKHLRERKEAFRVLVKDASFPFLKRYPALIKRNPTADKAGAAGYEISMDFNGAPIELFPKTAAEMKSGARIQVLSVNADEMARKRCCKLVALRKGRWELSNAGENRINLLIY